MVVFTCNHCGESLQKPKVEKHYQFACRAIKSLTCVDCFKDFRGEDYVVHIKCVTEEERYAAKGSIQGGIVKKGEVKQESWVEMIKSILEKETNIAPNHKNLLNTICEYSNVPRKKPKFINFIKSSSGGRVNIQDIQAVWDIIEKHKISSHNIKTNGKSSDHAEEQKTNVEQKKKRKLAEDCDQAVPKKSKIDKRNKAEANKENGTIEVKEEAIEKFSFQSKILEILQKKGSISLKKLEKKVFTAYTKYAGETENAEKVMRKIGKKLKKTQGIEINEDTVSLIAS